METEEGTAIESLLRRSPKDSSDLRLTPNRASALFDSPQYLYRVLTDRPEAISCGCRSSLWIAAPGGEYGLDSSYVPGQDVNAYKPAIVTTAHSGCANAMDSQMRTALTDWIPPGKNSSLLESFD
jgi:hypothetical protein